jgi:uncharacterized protein
MKVLALAFFAVLLGADFAIPPVPAQYVSDTAGVLTDSTRTWVQNELRNYEQQTGHQVLVYIGRTTGNVPLETWTGETADHWGIGRKKHDDGAVLFVFMNDRKVRIEVGYGLESSLTDADSFRIIQQTILPRMRSGDVDGAISYGVAAMLQTITPSFKNAPPPTPQTQPMDAKSVLALIILGGFLLFALVVIVRLSMGGRGGYFIGSGLGGGGFFGGGGGFGGGGFSAGGGGFGGGGASGGW